jgi:hypothetical protein
MGAAHFKVKRDELTRAMYTGNQTA